jgi:ferredoxin
MREVYVNQELCVGCGICVDNVSDVFHLNSNGKAECFDPHGATETQIQLEAIAVCPINCIEWKQTCIAESREGGEYAR